MDRKSTRGTKKIIFLAFLIIISILAFLGYKTSEKNKEVKEKFKGYKIMDYKLEGRELKLLAADTPEKMEKGLMFQRELDGVDGMIFLLGTKEIQHFWNKNTYMDLDLYWIDGEKVIGKSYLPSIEKSKEIVSVQSPQPADKAIEIPTSTSR